MKKIIFILFLFFMCLSCYIIYELTEKKELKITAIGDSIANLEGVNNTFTGKEYRIIDLINIIKYNEEKNNISIHQILKNSDILIISIGMNDIYYKIDNDTKEIYTYLNDMINDYDNLLKELSKYDYEKVYILGYYNIYNTKNDIFTYINYKLMRLANTYNYTYLNLNKVFYNNEKYYQNSAKYYLNSTGYRQILKLIVEKDKKT